MAPVKADGSDGSALVLAMGAGLIIQWRYRHHHLQGHRAHHVARMYNTQGPWTLTFTPLS